jgi:hypothetical protein
MTNTQPAGDARLGARPAAENSTGGCGTCGHPYALHSNGKTPCRAFACTAGPDETPCQEYVAPADEPIPERLAS